MSVGAKGRAFVLRHPVYIYIYIYIYISDVRRLIILYLAPYNVTKHNTTYADISAHPAAKHAVV